MKTILAFFAFSTLISANGIANADTTSVKSTKKVEVKDQGILSAADEQLFFGGRLGETVVQPVYTSVEQLIFSQQVKEVKKED